MISSEQIDGDWHLKVDIWERNKRETAIWFITELMGLTIDVLKLQACKYLDDSSLEPLYKEGALPDLYELDLSYGSLSQYAIEELLACCTHLTHVSLNGCVNMHDLDWGFSSDRLSSICGSADLFSQDDAHLPMEQPNRLLQNLNCVGCPNIKKVLIPPAAGCFQLLSLNLSLSANLKEVDVVCLNLCFLNLSNCCSLEILKLKCPKLTSLFLQLVAAEVCIVFCYLVLFDAMLKSGGFLTSIFAGGFMLCAAGVLCMFLLQWWSDGGSVESERLYVIGLVSAEIRWGVLVLFCFGHRSGLLVLFCFVFSLSFGLF
ncbi:hypothetical protein TEA_014541 [Camellia sinensis var. sinensis]|uniref:Uncharacterized protein n=1 Tax=Camellia sinensis var. sinensis TaxID=542762 RepID=A0A4S4E9U9_CAMSN|nr:hypothetical protein TEA_014541 [Camellia sinensis var. sinensis]